MTALQAIIHEEKSEQLDKLIPALIKAKPEFKPILRLVQGHGYKYADLEIVINSISESLQNNNLLVQQMTSILNDKQVIITYLFHESGQYFKSTMYIELEKTKAELLHEEKKEKVKAGNKYQDFGLAISYIRRYAILLILGLTQEDNDAASLSKSEVTQNTQVQELSKEHIEALETLKDLCKIQNINSIEFSKKFNVRKSDLSSIKNGIKNFPEFSAELLSQGAVHADN